MSNKSMGQYIKKQRNVSLRKLGEQIGISHSYLWDVERGNRNITIDMAQRIVAGLVILCGGDARQLYDNILIKAGLVSPEREALLELRARPSGVWRDVMDLGLYESLERHIKSERG